MASSPQPRRRARTAGENATAATQPAVHRAHSTPAPRSAGRLIQVITTASEEDAAGAPKLGFLPRVSIRLGLRAGGTDASVSGDAARRSVSLVVKRRPRPGKVVTTTVSVDHRVVLFVALLALIASAAGLSISTERTTSPPTEVRRLKWTPRAPRRLSTCNCEWTTEYACPLPGRQEGTKGFAEDDGTTCFQSCCPGASAAERIRTLLTQMLLDTEISALLPTLPEEERNARKHANQLINGQQETASVLLDEFTQAPSVTNFTTGLVVYFTKIDPKFLRWSSEEQERWLTRTLVLKRRVHVMNQQEFLDGLVSSIQDFLEHGADDRLFPAYDTREQSEDLDDMRLDKTAEGTSAEEILDKTKDTILMKAEQHIEKKAKDRLLAKTAVQILQQVRSSDGLASHGAEVAEFTTPLLLGAAAAPGTAGGAAITSGLANLGAVFGGGMAAGTVAAALAPVLAGVGTTMLILPDNNAGTAGKVAAGVAAPVALGGVYMATTAGGAGGSAMMSTLAGWGGGTLAAGGGGAAGGVVAIGGVAALAVVAVGVGVWGTVEIADYMIVTDEEREAFQCDCEWTLTYACPSSDPAAYKKDPTSPHWAKNDGSMCFDYCCGFFEEVKHVASEIIDQRDLLVSEVYEAQKQYVVANAPGALLSANPTGTPLFLFFAVLGGVGIVAVGARRLRSVSML